MLKQLFHLVLLLLPVISNSCTTSTLTIKSDPPEAEVKILFPSDTTLGVTPFTLTEETFEEAEELDIYIIKKGYQTKLYTIPALSHLKTDSHLFVKLPPEQAPAPTNNLAAIFAQLAKTKDLIEKQNYNMALKATDKGIEMAPNIPQFYLLKGKILLAEKRIPEALTNWRKARSVDPGNKEAFESIKKYTLD